MNEKVEAKQTREPDIAFWFDKEDNTNYLVKVREDITHIELVQACFDLLAKVIRSDLDTVVGEFKREVS